MPVSLLEAIHTPSERVIYQATSPSASQQQRAVNGQRKLPAPGETPADTYPTRWGGTLTLEQIIADSQVRRAAFAKAGYLGLDDQDREDCVQQGFIRLWQQLRADPTLLADKGPQWTGIYVAYSGNPKQFHRHNLRQRALTRPSGNGRNAEEFGRLGRLSEGRATRADWTTEVDEALDVSRFLNTMHQHYADQPHKQVALQAVIGAISAKEAARELGLHPKNFAASVGNAVRQEVQARLPDTFKQAQPEAWKAWLARGEGLEHIAQIAQAVMHDTRLLLALYVVTTAARKQDVARTFGYGLTAFGKDVRQIKRLIAARYRREQRRQEQD